MSIWHLGFKQGAETRVNCTNLIPHEVPHVSLLIQLACEYTVQAYDPRCEAIWTAIEYPSAGVPCQSSNACVVYFAESCVRLHPTHQ